MTVRDLPDGWSVVKMRNLATIKYGRDPSPILQPDGEYPVYGTSGAVRRGTEYLHEGDSIILGRKGSIDRVRLVRGKFWTIDTAYFLTDFVDAIPQWLFYSLQRVDLRSLNEATGVPSLARDTLYMIEFAKPPEQEQQRIVDVVAAVDQAIQQSTALLAKQLRIKTGVLRDLFTGGVDEHGDPRSEETHEFKDSAMGRIPMEWEASTLGRFAKFASGYAFKEHELTEDGWGVVRISNLHKPDFPFWHYKGRTKASWLVTSGDVLFSWAGVASSIDCVRYHGPDALLNQHIYNLLFPSADLKAFIYFYLQNYLPKLRTEIEGGAGQLHLTKEKIRSIPVPELPSAELARVVSVLETTETMMAVHRSQIAKLERLRSGVMADLLDGVVRVGETAPQIVGATS